MGEQINVNLEDVSNIEHNVDMNTNDNIVSHYEHILNNISRLISIALTHIYLIFYTKGPKILVLSQILEISGWRHSAGRYCSKKKGGRRHVYVC